LPADYDRDVFAFPGAVGAPYSEGCNELIRDRRADLITSAQDFVNAMRWNDDSTLVKAQKEGIERQMFPQLTEEENKIVEVLSQSGDMQTNILAVRTGIPIGQLAAHLFSLEMKGVLKSFAGGTYHLIN
jgi:DNA processing protein